MTRTLILIPLLLMGLCWSPARATGETFTGSGFVVSEYGDLVTNEHVVSGCRTVAVKQGGRSYLATVLASDKDNDLALVRMPPQVKPTEIATLRQSPPLRAGEQAIAFGFPLAGVLATEGNLTIGYVSALHGLGDDPNSIQITTPIQPGNSGGPLLDSSGNVIGVVTAKLDALNIMRIFGDVPQNINFAVDLATLKRFLAAHSVGVPPAPSTGDLRPADIGERAKLFTYFIECERASIAHSTRPSPPPAPRSADTPAPAPSALIPIDISKLKWSDIRQPYPSIRPEIFELNISNAGSDRVTELTIAFRRTRGQPCSRDLEKNDGSKRFRVNLRPGDSVTLTGDFSARAASFCIVRALGPPEGLAACSNSSVPSDAAIIACTRIIQSGEVHGTALVAAYVSRGNRYGKEGDYDRAIVDYTKAIHLDPKLDYTFWRRGLAYTRKKEHDRAIADYSEAIRLNPNRALAYINRGYAFHSKGDYNRAIADYDEAIRISPSYTTAYHNRGFAYFAKGEHDRAIADYTEAIRLNEQYASSYRNRGIAYLYSGSRAKARADLEMATQLRPKDAYVALWRELAERRANAPSTLAHVLSQIEMGVWPAPVIRLLLRETTPAALLASAKESDPKKSRERLCEANFFIGQLALQRGSKEEAKRAFQIAVRDCPPELLEMGAATAELTAGL
jgi:lipoprotein NlpI